MFSLAVAFLCNIVPDNTAMLPPARTEPQVLKNFFRDIFCILFDFGLRRFFVAYFCFLHCCLFFSFSSSITHVSASLDERGIDFTFDGIATYRCVFPSCGKSTTRSLSEVEVWSYKAEVRNIKAEIHSFTCLLVNSFTFP
jgi:hypothetical protein